MSTYDNEKDMLLSLGIRLLFAVHRHRPSGPNHGPNHLHSIFNTESQYSKCTRVKYKKSMGRLTSCYITIYDRGGSESIVR